MEIQQIQEDIYSYLKHEMNHARDFDPASNIIEEGMIDSMGVLTLVNFLENRFGIEIPFEDLNPDNFANVGTIAHFIQRLA